MLKYYKNFWINYVNFKGESSRKEFWSTFLINFIIFTILFTIGYFVTIIAIIDIVIAVGFIIPSISIVVRRLHDTGRSGYNIFWGLIPIFGWIFLLAYLIDKTKK